MPEETERETKKYRTMIRIAWERSSQNPHAPTCDVSFSSHEYRRNSDFSLDSSWFVEAKVGLEAVLRGWGRIIFKTDSQKVEPSQRRERRAVFNLRCPRTQKIKNYGQNK